MPGLIAPASRQAAPLRCRRAACNPPSLTEPGATEIARGRLLYLLHLGVILWWLLDKSRGQRATRGLLSLWRRMLPSATLALRLPLVRGAVEAADMLFREALLDGPEPEFR